MSTETRQETTKGVRARLIELIPAGRLYCGRCHAYDHDCGCTPDVRERRKHEAADEILALLATPAAAGPDARTRAVLRRSLIEHQAAAESLPDSAGDTHREIAQEIRDVLAAPPAAAEPQDCTVCEGTGEEHVPTSVPDDEGFQPCGVCEGSGKKPTDEEIRALREERDQYRGDLYVAEQEMKAYRERYAGRTHPFDAAPPVVEGQAAELLRRLRQWDHLREGGDGEYWRAEIDRVLAATPPQESGRGDAMRVLAEAVIRLDGLYREEQDVGALDATQRPQWLRNALDIASRLTEREGEQEMRDLLAEVAASGVTLDDGRLDYVEVQLYRETWDAVRAVAEREGVGDG